jgi:nitrite reductase (NO-forming)
MLGRRDALWFGTGIAAGAAGLGWWRARRSAPPAPTPLAPSSTQLRYGHGAMPPASLGPLSLDQVTKVPPGPAPGPPATRTFALDVIEHRLPVSVEHSIDAWTFGGTLPGPILRAAEGDNLEITLRNRTTRAHNLHFHGRHEVDADGWEPIAPGGESTYRLTAGPAGLHPYHCDFTPTEDHIAAGLYGVLIVDGRRRRPPAEEFSLVLGGFDVDGDGSSELFGWNGVAGFYAKYPIKVPAGALVRVYLTNLVMDRPLASFHLHAETFDVYRSGRSLVPDENTDILTLGPAERAVVEFRLPRRGRYMFHPHQTELAEAGAMGWFSAV